ncbi:hypothetical protein LA080_015607 [Diaporthe eres]|nr:hypothetical protein LA080_015607 [Diaporthe eres]
MRASRERPSARPTGRRSACFNPDGSAEPYAVPCASEGESHCCSGASGICLSNGYCMEYQQPFAIWRGSCTDSTWGSANCPKVCTVLGVAGLWNAQYVSSTNSTSDASSATMPTAGSPAQDDDCSSQKKDTITVGSILGVSLVAVTIALVLWALWERRQKILWWQRAIGLPPEWPPKHAAWMRSLGQKSSKPPPCPITRAKLLYAAHQQHNHAQEQQPAPTCGTHQPEISSPQRPREMPAQDVTPPAAEMDAT